MNEIDAVKSELEQGMIRTSDNITIGTEGSIADHSTTGY